MNLTVPHFVIFTGCKGPPPQDYEGKEMGWVCDPGYSNLKYSVYFSCALVCNVTNKVHFEYYCNEDLEWILTRSTSETCAGTCIVIIIYFTVV